MIFLERIGSGGDSYCRGCGDSAMWRVMFSMGARVSPTQIDLCNPCVEELSLLAGARSREVPPTT